MKIENFIKKIEKEFDDLEPGKLKPDSNFRDIFEWNSINALIIIAMIKTEYNVAISADDLNSSKTTRDLFNIIQSRVKVTK